MEASHRAIILHEIQMTFSGKVKQLLPPAAQSRQ
jgi:hypothetical protein